MPDDERIVKLKKGSSLGDIIFLLNSMGLVTQDKEMIKKLEQNNNIELYLPEKE